MLKAVKRMLHRKMCEWFGFTVVIHWYNNCQQGNYWDSTKHVYYSMSLEEINEWIACYPANDIHVYVYAGGKSISVSWDVVGVV